MTHRVVQAWKDGVNIACDDVSSRMGGQHAALLRAGNGLTEDKLISPEAGRTTENGFKKPQEEITLHTCWN